MSQAHFPIRVLPHSSMTGTFTLVLKNVASLGTAATYASLTPMMYGIYKDRSVGEKSFFPLVAMLANSHIW